MTIKVAINGYGRIGRNILRAHYEDGKKHDLAIVVSADALFSLTDLHGLDPQDAIASLVHTATTLTRAALRDNRATGGSAQD